MYQPILSVALVPLVFFSVIYAQGKSGELPGAKPTPTPAPRSGTTTRPAPRTTSPPSAASPVMTTLAFNQEVRGKLDPQSSDKSQTGNYYQEYIVNAKSDDLISIQLQSSSPGLGLQILDKDKAEVGVTKDPSTGEFKLNTPGGGLPADGQYRVRVTGALSGRNSLPFTLKVNRLGLVQNVYSARIDKILMSYRETDPASVNETVAGLEELVKDDNSKPAAHEMLGIIYFNNRRDAVKAEQAMEEAIKAKGAGVIKISFDGQWRRMAKLRSGRIDWEDPRTGWLRIYAGKLILTDTGNRPLAAAEGSQIKEVTKVVTNNVNLVAMTVEGTRRPFVFLPGNKDSADADLVMRLILKHVMRKGN